MADQRSDVVGDHQSLEHVAAYGLTQASNPSGHGSTQGDGGEIYKPLPVGCWRIPFHGNCPRCHHYHKAVEIKVKVTSNPSRVSYVHCEHCNDKWAAFGGRNSTKVSLLSTATSDPDPIEEGVRYSLIDIVNMVTERARLSGSKGSSLLTASRYPSTDAHAKNGNPPFSPRPIAHRSTLGTEDVQPSEAAQQYQLLRSARTSSTKHDTAEKHRSSVLQSLSRMKVKVTGHFRTLHRGTEPDHGRLSPQPRMTGRQFDKSPVRAPAVPNSFNTLAEELPVTVPSREGPRQQETATPETSEVSVAHPTTRLAEVVAFIRDLDKPRLESMGEEERDKWMRATYTNFKARNRRLTGPLPLSSITESSVANEFSHPLRQFNRRSAEVRGIGAHAEGLESVRLSFNRNSLAFSDLMDDSSAPEDSIGRSTPQNTVRPTSQHLRRVLDPEIPSGPPSPRRRYHSGRGSFDSRMHRRVGSTSSLRAQLGTLSQGSITVYGSSTTLDRLWSHDMVRGSEYYQWLQPEREDLQPPRPPFSFGRNYSDSPPPPSTSRDSSDSTRE
jgi:hypothetical protein